MSSEEQQEELFSQIQKAEYEFLSPYWDTVSEDAIDIVRRLLVVNKNKRMTAQKILTHHWIKANTSKD